MMNLASRSNTAIRMWHFLRIPNVGDLVGPNIVSHISNHRTLYCANPEKSRLFAIGSILGAADSKTSVWGSGLMDPDQSPQLVGSNIFAVRGKLTYSRLRDIGINMPDIALGDPGFLASSLFKTNGVKQYRLGVIPHYVDRQHPVVQKLVQEDGVRDIDVRQRPEEFFRELEACETIVSSSLHGLIFAEAFGIPNLWIKLSDRVVRTGFKFHDWFSLAEKPQRQPYEPTLADTAHQLLQRSALHDCKISREELSAAFPTSRIEEMSDTVPRTFVSLSSSRRRPLPVFVISYNRPGFLKRAIDSYRRLKREVEIIVHDNGSDNAETLQMLESLRREGVIIYKHRAIHCADELNQVNETVADYFQHWSEPSRYVVTDCDVDLSIADPAALDVYDELLDRYTAAQCVGPMLRIRDIPKSYPLFRQVMSRHIDQFWHKKPEWIELPQGRVATIEAPIDTTFALHRAGEPFHRLKLARRVYYPYEAKHLDWYLNPKEYAQSIYFSTSSPEISHWNNISTKDREKSGRHNIRKIIYVDQNHEGKLVEKTLDISEQRSLWFNLKRRILRRRT